MPMRQSNTTISPRILAAFGAFAILALTLHCSNLFAQQIIAAPIDQPAIVPADAGPVTAVGIDSPATDTPFSSPASEAPASDAPASDAPASDSIELAAPRSGSPQPQSVVVRPIADGTYDSHVAPASFEQSSPLVSGVPQCGCSGSQTLIYDVQTQTYYVQPQNNVAPVQYIQQRPSYYQPQPSYDRGFFRGRFFRR